MGGFSALPNIETIKEQAIALAKFKNATALRVYELELESYLAMRDVNKHLGIPTLPPAPPLRVTYELDPLTSPVPTFKAVYGEPLAPPYKDPEPPPPPPANNTDLGPVIEDGSGRITAGPRDTQPVSTVITVNGRRYMRMQIGAPGTINYAKFYAPMA